MSEADVIELGAGNGLQPLENWENRDKYHAGNAACSEVLQMKAFYHPGG
jgi:hypothetical protein